MGGDEWGVGRGGEGRSTWAPLPYRQALDPALNGGAQFWGC